MEYNSYIISIMGCCHNTSIDHDFFMGSSPNQSGNDARDDGVDNLSASQVYLKKSEGKQIFRLKTPNSQKPVLPTPTFGSLNSNTSPFRFEDGTNSVR
ncbi:unnamed protein product [Blepharisma stoltei]|uniref:Uncharacterized protein n=1 Tax=Blepharisma stoltei TaxID=1481888 RepID=A0AAU9ISB9_9CILI|nr:unnamed protein product [Blepharisma stoltei]